MEALQTASNMSQPKPAAEPEPEPEPKTDFTPKNTTVPTAKIEAEPFPDFENAPKSWDIAWLFYIYGTGSAFALLSIYSVYSTLTVILLSKNQSKRRKNIRSFIIAINLQIILLGFCRAISLLIDPYNFRLTFLPLVYDVLFNIPFPCLTSAFGLVNWVVLQVSKIKMSNTSKIRSVSFLMTVILSHYIIVVTVGILTHLVMHVQFLIIVCQGFFVVWGFLLSVGFFVGAVKIYRLETSTRGMLYQNTLANLTPMNHRKSLENSAVTSTSSPTSSPNLMRKARGLESPFPSPKASPNLIRKVRGPLAAVQSPNLRKKRCRPVSARLSSPPPPSPHLARNARGSRQVYTITAEILQPVSVVVTPVSMTIKGDTMSEESFSSEECTIDCKNQENKSRRMALTGIILQKRRNVSSDSNSLELSQLKSQPNLQSRSRSTTGKVLRISAAAAVLGFAASGLNLFGILVVYSESVTLGSNGTRPGLWEWYSYQFLFRLIELAMGCTMAYFTTAPSLRKRR